MTFPAKLWSDDDPAYAPCRVPTRDLFYWVAPRKYVALGYAIRRERLTGRAGDDLDDLRAMECRQHTRRMLEHFGQLSQEPGTWGWIIAKWKVDPHARYLKIKGNTRTGYDHLLDRWAQTIGRKPVSAMTYEAAGQIVTGMEADGRSQDDMARMFGILRTIARYAAATRMTGARDVVDALGMFRFEGGKLRSVAATRDQVMQIIAAADAKGLHAFGTGVLIQWTYALRAVDVRGQWLPAKVDEGGIWRSTGGRRVRWGDGLTWGMFTSDLTSFRKVISKTAKAMPEAMEYDVTDQVRSRLLQIGQGVGPVILSAHGRPYDVSSWTRTWARLRTQCGIPDDVKMMDVRAGAITEAKSMGLDPYAIRDMAGHRHLSTTDGYARGRSDTARKVRKLRIAQ